MIKKAESLKYLNLGQRPKSINSFDKIAGCKPATGR